MGIMGKTHDVEPDQQSDDEMAPSASHEAEGKRSMMDKLRHPFPELRDKLKDTHLHDVKVKAINMKHQVGKFENLFNTNHRHDEAHEKATDAKRTKTAEAHRFQSFAPEREGNRVKWYIDGRDYFWAVSVALERATETIYIADWWLSPELFLRRPPYYNQEWRLDQTLKRAAERGVKIYVVVYKEVQQALTCNSAHTKHALEALCPAGSKGHKNIVVMRHPDHNVFENASDMTFYWAHHEKFLVIDYDLAFIGGLDMCFGRWDTKQHPLADAHPAGVQNEVFPGQDFNNNRIMDFQGVADWKSNELSKAEYGRMPWHDVAMGVIGPCVYDIAAHFVLRWNFCKRDKYKRDARYDWLVLDGMQDNEDLIGVQRPKHPVGEYRTHPLSALSGKTGRPNQGRSGHVNLQGSSDARETGQALDTSSNLQAATGAQRPTGRRGDTAGSDGEEFHDALETLDEHGYTAGQHMRGHGWEKRLDAHRIHRPHPQTEKTLPELPHDARENKGSGEADGVQLQQNANMTGNNPKKEGTVSASGGMAAKHGGYTSNQLDSDHQVTDSSQIVGQGTVHAQLVRSSADWSSGILTEQSIQNAYCQCIREAQHYVYIENQFFITATGDKQAPVHNQIGAAIADAVIRAGKEKRKFRVIVLIPTIPGFAGDLRDDAAAGTRAIMDYQYKSICRGDESIYGKCKAAGVDPTQHIFFFNLRSYDRLNKTPGLKAQEEKSGVKYQEVQRAQAEEIMSGGVHGVEDDSSSSDGQGDDANQEQKERTVDRKRRFEQHRESAGMGGGEGSEGRDGTVPSDDSIAKDAMLGEKKVSDEAWAGRSPGNDDGKKDKEDRQQEMENFVQEELYIHGKTCIIDDRIVICGSSNINDRSQLGFHDSELSIVMEDTHPLPSLMDGQEYTAGHHAATLRRMLWREHLGLLHSQPLDASKDPNAQPPSDCDNEWYEGDEWDRFVRDPLGDELWEMWCERAQTNTQVFRHLFHADPDDHIKTFADYRHFLPRGDMKAGHLYDPYMPVENVRKELDKVKGHLVWMPLDFLKDATMAEAGLAVNSWTESVYT